MKHIKRISLVAGLGAAMVMAFAGPAAAADDNPSWGKDGKDKKVTVVTNDGKNWVNGEDQYCNAQGLVVIIANSCNGIDNVNGNNGNANGVGNDKNANGHNGNKVIVVKKKDDKKY